jgi:anthranilate phosphoribosyltransferase
MTFSHHLATNVPEHPFAEIIRILGKGKKGARSLSQDEAYRAMRMILTGKVLPEQLGAFLMLMRIKEETPEEIAGFVLAAKQTIAIEGPPLADLDWSTYAGKRRHLPWFLLTALLLAENGVRVFMHGAPGPASNRLYTEACLSYLGIQAATSIEDAKKQLSQHNFTYINLQDFCPQLQNIIDLRPILGLRSPVHTLVRMINPLNAPYSIQGIFHPSYRAVHQQAAAFIGQKHMAVLKGEGGETERNPDVDCLVQSVHGDELSDEIWPALFQNRHVKAESLSADQLAGLWSGKYEDEFGEASVIGTMAVALKLLAKAEDQPSAQQMATNSWVNRNKLKFKTD